jgi:hypothetical protein
MWASLGSMQSVTCLDLMTGMVIGGEYHDAMVYTLDPLLNNILK